MQLLIINSMGIVGANVDVFIYHHHHLNAVHCWTYAFPIASHLRLLVPTHNSTYELYNVLIILILLLYNVLVILKFNVTYYFVVPNIPGYASNFSDIFRKCVSNASNA